MLGKEYSAIRRYNRITQRKISEKMGYKTDFVIWDIENSTALVPKRFIKVLAELCELDLKDLLDEKWLADYYELIPDYYKYRNNYNPRVFRNVTIPIGPRKRRGY